MRWSGAKAQIAWLGATGLMFFAGLRVATRSPAETATIAYTEVLVTIILRATRVTTDLWGASDGIDAAADTVGTC
jgi:hypothetical protein